VLQKPRRGSLIGGIVAAILVLGIVLAGGWLLLNRQYVADQLTVWSYEPAASVSTIEDRLLLTNDGQFYFYAAQPRVAPAEDFNEECPRQEPGSPILGCYAYGKIYIFDIENETLDGIEEVTAAHEMLHVAWDRLGVSEKERLSTLLLQVYEAQKTPELEERIEYYERTQPGEVVNELHSILPTEVQVLNDELETYYAQYFEDRSAIVSLYEQYNAVFVLVVDRIETLFQDLTVLSATIEQRRTVYETSVQLLAADITEFNTRANNGDFASQQQFNVERSVLIQRTNSLETERQSISILINRYNTQYEEYVTLATELQSLNQSIDSISELEEAPQL